MVTNGTDWNECEFARRFAQVEADENSHTHVLLKVVGLKSKENDRIKQKTFKLSCIYS